MGVRRQAREAALQALFMCDFISEWNLDTVEVCLDHFGIPKNVHPYSVQLCNGVIAELAKVDSALTCASEHWSLNRMGRVDRAILRLAAYELLFLDDIPVNVAINEAIEIAKRFGSEESRQFVNGVLDRVASSARPKLQVEVIREVVEDEALLPIAVLETADEEVLAD